MYYGGLSFFWVVVFVIALIYINRKVNRLIDRLDALAKKEPVHAQSPAVPPPLGTVASAFGAPPAPSATLADLAEGKTPLSSRSTPTAADASASGKHIDTEEKGGQWLGKVGVLAIILGVSFFLKWAFENNLVGPMGRVMLGVIGGIVFVGVGQFLRKKYLVYSDIVSGGGIAILYLSIFAAFAFYHFIGQEVAMVLMFFVTALSVTLSVIGGTQQLAVLGILGGLLTPLLVSTGANNFWGLMGYLIVLDLGILGVAIFKKWSRLNLLGFIGTAMWFVLWYERFYRAADLPEVFLVLSVFFVIYLVAGIVHNVLWKKLSRSEDLFLITFNAALYALGAFSILNPLYHGSMGFFMFFLSVFYFLVAFVAYRMNPEDNILNLYLPGIAIVFLTLAMPIQFSGKWITLAWLIESALLIGVGSLVRRHSMNVFGLIVFGIGLVRLFAFDMYVPDISTYLPVFNFRFFLTLVAIIVAYFTGFMFIEHLGDGDDKGRKGGAIAFFVIANLLSLFILTAEINAHYAKSIQSGQSRFSVERTGFYDNGGGELSERAQNEFRQNEEAFYQVQRSTQNRRNTVVSIAWALYAVALTAIGFGAKRRLMRLLGLSLFFVTAFKVLIDVWALGEVYKIVSSISFGVIALLVSFAYAKFKHRLQEVL